MPELPEVETTLRGIEPHLSGQVISKITVRNDRLRWPVPVQSLQNLVGLRIDNVGRRAKYILLFTAKGTVLLHLGMSGSMRVLPAETPPEKHDHIDIEVGSAVVVRLNDPRRFGCCLLIEGELETHKLLAKLGPEPLNADFTGDYLFQCSRGKTMAVKNFIMDGHVVVGVGNIYASESLFEAKIRPTTQAGKVSRQRYQNLAMEIKAVLAKAIKVGGTTLNDFTQTDGKPGYFRHQLQVYARVGEPCNRCGGLIKSTILGQRNTFYCSVCQK